MLRSFRLSFDARRALALLTLVLTHNECTSGFQYDLPGQQRPGFPGLGAPVNHPSAFDQLIAPDAAQAVGQTLTPGVLGVQDIHRRLYGHRSQPTFSRSGYFSRDLPKKAVQPYLQPPSPVKPGAYDWVPDFKAHNFDKHDTIPDLVVGSHQYVGVFVNGTVVNRTLHEAALLPECKVQSGLRMVHLSLVNTDANTHIAHGHKAGTFSVQFPWSKSTEKPFQLLPSMSGVYKCVTREGHLPAALSSLLLPPQFKAESLAVYQLVVVVPVRVSTMEVSRDQQVSTVRCCITGYPTPTLQIHVDDNIPIKNSSVILKDGVTTVCGEAHAPAKAHAQTATCIGSQTFECSKHGRGPSYFESNCRAAQSLDRKSMKVEHDPCIEDPCKNGGTCTKLSETGFSCSCTKNFTGFTCESRSSKCPPTLLVTEPHDVAGYTFDACKRTCKRLGLRLAGIESEEDHSCITEQAKIKYGGTGHSVRVWVGVYLSRHAKKLLLFGSNKPVDNYSLNRKNTTTAEQFGVFQPSQMHKFDHRLEGPVYLEHNSYVIGEYHHNLPRAKCACQ